LCSTVICNSLPKLELETNVKGLFEIVLGYVLQTNICQIGELNVFFSDV